MLERAERWAGPGSSAAGAAGAAATAPPSQTAAANLASRVGLGCPTRTVASLEALSGFRSRRRAVEILPDRVGQPRPTREARFARGQNTGDARPDVQDARASSRSRRRAVEILPDASYLTDHWRRR
jgi:hypothetical protein